MRNKVVSNKTFKRQLEQGRLRESVHFPKVVLLDTISYCNLRCSMCVHKDMRRRRGVMTWPLFKKIIDEIARRDKKVRVWLVFFGEALLLKRSKPSIFDLIAYAKKKGLRDVVLNSNATLLDEQAGRNLIAAGLDAIYIGLDAFSPQTYAKIRVGGDYKKTVANILNFLALKKELAVKKPEVFVQFVEMDNNKREKTDFIKFWKKQGVNVKIRPKVSWAGKIPAPNQVLKDSNRWPCYWAMRTMSITDRGKVVTCAVDVDARYVAGDVNKNTLAKIWNGSLHTLRICQLEGQFGKLPKICRECRDWQSARADYYLTNK